MSLLRLLAAAAAASILSTPPAAVFAQTDEHDAASTPSQRPPDAEEGGESGQDERPPGAEEGGESGQTGETEPEEDPFSDFDDFSVPGSELDDPGALDLRRMEREELEGAGFEFGDASRASASTSSLLALTAGFILHGLGHMYMGDSRTGTFLMILEAIGIGLMTGAGVYFAVTGGADAGTGIVAPLFQGGVGLFVVSYLMDVLGAVQGTDIRLSGNSRMSRGVGIDASYGYLNADGQTYRHAIRAGALLDLGGFYTSARTVQDIFLDTAIYRATIGGRPWRGPSELTHLYVEGSGEYLQFSGVGQFARGRLEGRVGGSYDFGRDFTQFGAFAVGGDVGFGTKFYWIPPGESATFEMVTAKPYVPFDVYAHFNLTSRLNIRGGYGTPEGTLIAPFHRLLGVAHIDVLFRNNRYADLHLRAEMGDGAAIWLGTTIWFGR